MKRRNFNSFNLAFLNGISPIKFSVSTTDSHRGKSIAIYGAGEAGQQLFDSLIRAPGFNPVLFIDDDTQLDNALIKNTLVINSSKIASYITSYGIEEILLAIPSATTSQRKQMIEKIQQQHIISVRTLPTLSDIVMGTVNMTQLKNVDIADVLGRQMVEPNDQLMSDAVKGKTIVITGAGGSIGSEICNQVLHYQPKALILIDNSEYNLYQVQRKCVSTVQNLEQSTELVAKLISVTDAPSLLAVMQQYQPQLCFHAAAYKHVPLVEENAQQAFINNSLGTQICAQACITAKVPKFILISTDKAVRPTNIMGATKRIAELVLQSFTDSHTQFSMVRFGNVLESSGSVIPLFREQIQGGGPVTVTDKGITRYFMTIPEAAQLVIQSSELAKGGDVFLLDMGDPIKIDNLAKQLITLSGYSVKSDENPNGDIEINYTGLRAGEKLYEELLIDSANANSTEHEKIWRANESSIEFTELNNYLMELSNAFESTDRAKVEQLLQRPEVGFNIQTT